MGTVLSRDQLKGTEREAGGEEEGREGMGNRPRRGVKKENMQVETSYKGRKGKDGGRKQGEGVAMSNKGRSEEREEKNTQIVLKGETS